MRSFEHVNASSMASALSLMDEGSRPIAGGTDLLPLMKLGVASPQRLVNLKTIPGLDGISFDEVDGLQIGALTKLTDIEAAPVVKSRYRALYEAVYSAASPQLRNTGTMGGNLCQDTRCWYYRGEFRCWLKGGGVCYAAAGENSRHAVFGDGPCHSVHPSDLAVALIALGAEVKVVGDGVDRDVPLGTFYQLPREGSRKLTILEPTELVKSVRVPAPETVSRGTYVKSMGRAVWSFAEASVAAQLTFEGEQVSDARIVLGGVAPIPWRVTETEKTLIGRRLDDSSVSDAARVSVKGARPLRQNAHKLPLIEGVVATALKRLMTPLGPP